MFEGDKAVVLSSSGEPFSGGLGDFKFHSQNTWTKITKHIQVCRQNYSLAKIVSIKVKKGELR